MTRPLQPIKDHRFVENKIVSYLLDKGPIDLNDLGFMDFDKEDWAQFVQLLGYSLSGASNYMLPAEIDAAYEIADNGLNEKDAMIKSLKQELKEIKKHLRKAAIAAFDIHPDNLEY